MRVGQLKVWVLSVVLLMSTATVYADSDGPRRRANSVWGASYFPNIPLTTHEGKSVRFFDDLIKDKVVAINFIYTTCPDSCPLETARLREVQQILGDRVGKDVFFYSITIDPDVDTPEVLKKYRELYNVGPGWTFLTGDEADIILLRKKLGLYIQEIQDGSNDHNLSLIIGNQATGRWMKSSPFENPYVLARQIGEWLHNWKMPNRKRESYAKAPKLRTLGKGESLFRTRCNACHTIGSGDINELAQRRVGPDLKGVIQMRDRAWLARWLREPEKMIADQDPIVMGLMAKYSNLPMPNMRLNKIEVDYLLDYIDTETRRLDAVQASAELAAAKAPAGKKPCCMKRKNAALSASKDPAPETVAASQAKKPCCDKMKRLALDKSHTPNLEVDANAHATKPCCEKMQGLVLGASDTPDSDDVASIVTRDAPKKEIDTPVLMASKTIDVDPLELQESVMSSGKNASPRSHRTGFLGLPMFFSFGLGCGLFVLAASLRRSPHVEHQT